MAEADGRRAVVATDPELVPSDKAAPAAHAPDPVVFGDVVEAAGQLPDQLVGPLTDAVHIHRAVAEVDAPADQFVRPADGLDHLEQCLGRNATPEQADAAEALLVADERDIE